MRKVGVVLTALLLSGAWGCAKKEDERAQKLPERIQAGASQRDAEQVLDRCGFIHSFDQKTSVIYAMKRGGHGGLVKEDWSAQIRLDEGRKVESVKVGKVLTGP